MLKIAGPLFLACFALGCGDTTSNTPADMTAVVVPHNWDEINAQIIQGGCAAFSVCHRSDGARDANMLNLDNMDVDGKINDPYAALVGADAVNKKAKAEGKLRVKPCDSANSFLIIKLKLPTNEDTTTGYGHYMPDTNPHLPNEQIQAIADWIDRGALKNEPATVTGKTCTIVNDLGSSHD